MQQVLHAQAFAVLICTTCLPSGAASHRLTSTQWHVRRMHVLFACLAVLLCIQAWLNTDGGFWKLKHCELSAAGKRLVTGSHDKYMMLADIQGHVQRTWKASHVHDLAISKDGSLLFCVTSEKKVQSITSHPVQESAGPTSHKYGKVVGGCGWGEQ